GSDRERRYAWILVLHLGAASVQLQCAPRGPVHPSTTRGAPCASSAARGAAPIAPDPLDEEDDPAASEGRPQPPADLDDPVRDRAARGEFDDLVHAAPADLVDRPPACEVLGPPPSVHVHDAAVVPRGEEPDGGQGADHAVVGPAQPLEVDPVVAGECAGLLLPHRLTLAAPAEGDDLGRDE